MHLSHLVFVFTL